MKKCVFAGTFDPPTAGHKKVVENCLKIFDEVVVALLINPEKQCLFTIDERTALLKKLFAISRVRVVSFDGALVDLLEKENTVFLARGVRNTVDFEYENAAYFANKKLKSDIVAIYFPAEQEDLHISSTLVRSALKFNKQFTECIPVEIKEDIIKFVKDKNVY